MAAFFNFVLLGINDPVGHVYASNTEFRTASAGDGSHTFKRPIAFQHGEGTASSGRIDCFRLGCFVLEAKKLRSNAGSQVFDVAILRALAQAEGYARALPTAEGRPIPGAGGRRQRH